MTSDLAVQIHKKSVVKESIYGNHVRTSDVILTGLIYGLSLIHI